MRFIEAARWGVIAAAPTSAFAGLLSPEDDRTVIVLPAAVEPGAQGRSARERAAIRWAT